MLCVDQHCPCLFCELFNISLCNYVLKMRSDSAIADCLIVIWHVALETFLCKNSIVCVKYFHSDAKDFCHLPICCFGLDGFDEGLASLYVGIHVRGGMDDKNCRAQKWSDIKKPDICGMIPGVLEVNEFNYLLSPAAVYDSILMTRFSFPFTLQVFLSENPYMHDTQTGGWQDASLESKMPTVAITCISLIGTQWFVLSWISNSFICSYVRVLGVIALMISSASFVLFSRKISCLSFDFSCSSDAFSYASFLSDSEDF